MTTGKGIAIAGIWTGAGLMTFMIPPLFILTSPIALIATIIVCMTKE